VRWVASVDGQPERCRDRGAGNDKQGARDDRRRSQSSASLREQQPPRHLKDSQADTGLGRLLGGMSRCAISSVSCRRIGKWGASLRCRQGGSRVMKAELVRDSSAKAFQMINQAHTKKRRPALITV
jgi:hypothetical protein